ncbi:MAG: cytochrome c [Thermomicrobiales bacterium]
MSGMDQSVIKEHEYDGIQEYDNPTPGWWHLVFLGTCVFSICYYIFFQISPASWTVEESYDSAVAADLRLQYAEIGDLKADEETIVRFMNDARWLKVGQSTYKAQCVTCHGAEASGQIGPNLTDHAYKNVRVISDLARVIENGANNGAMPAWKTRLHPTEIVLTAAYLASLRGQNIPGREAEGIVIPPWPATAHSTADSEAASQ